MLGILRDYSLANIWCNPQLAHQYTISPACLTLRGGAFKFAKVMWDTVPLPNANVSNDYSYYHVYQIGQLQPGFFSLNLKNDTWYSVDSLCNNSQQVIDVFLSNGVKLLRGDCYLQFNSNKDFILAVRVNHKYNLGTELQGTTRLTSSLDVSTLNIRFYSNPVYNEPIWVHDSTKISPPIRTVSRAIKTMSDYFVFMAACVAIETQYGSKGSSIYQMDGFVIARPTGYDASYLGTTFSFMWDESIKAKTALGVPYLHQFTSTIDSKARYGFVTSANYGYIDFHGDIDFYLIATDPLLGFKGVYLGRQSDGVVRQLTHNAYSLSVAAVQALIGDHLFLSHGTVQLMAVTRQGAKLGILSNNANRIEALYKMSYANIVTAMFGSNATMPEWKAAALEASAYCQLIQYRDETFSDQLVEAALGYEAATQIAANPISQPLISGPHRFIYAPPVLQQVDKNLNVARRAMFAYYQGALAGYADLDGYGSPIIPSSIPNVDYVETFNYSLSNTLDGVFYDDGIETTDLMQYGFRCYVSPVNSGVPVERWSDVTGQEEYYLFDPVGNASNNFTPSIKWNTAVLAEFNLMPCVKINNTMLVNEFNGFSPYAGYIGVTVQSLVNWLGSPTIRPQSLPPGVIDVFMENQCLIEGVDFYVLWPKIIIVKPPVNQDMSQVNVLVRCYGFCNPQTMKNYPPREVGFIKGGMLSVNGEYDYRNDRNIRVTVSGQFMDRSQVNFAENNGGPLSVEGRPYSIADYQLPVEGYTHQTLLEWQNVSIDLDNRVDGFLSAVVSEASVPVPYILDYRWPVYSPFCSALINDLIAGTLLYSGELGSPYTADQVDTWVASYKWLLAADPCLLEAYSDYVFIQPHQFTNVLNLTAEQYEFIDFILSQYLNNKTSLSGFINVVG